LRNSIRSVIVHPMSTLAEIQEAVTRLRDEEKKALSL
jgi:hypothetical protein